MELTQYQKKYIKDKYIEFKNDDQTLGEILEVVVDDCLDNYIIDLSDDEDGDLYEEFTNNVWDFLETINNV
jgi:hypothetical protein